MKNLKVYLTLFVSILFFSQNLWAQGLKIENDQSSESKNRIETKTKVKVQTEISTLEKRQISSQQRKADQPAFLSNETISNNTPIVDKKVNTGAKQMTPSIKPEVSAPALEKKEVQATGTTVIAKKGTQVPLNQKLTTPASSQRVSNAAGNGNQTVLMNKQASGLFYGDAQIEAELKQTNLVLYKEYMKERQTVASVLNRVNANTFKNERERTKYTQLLNDYKQKYNF